MKKAIVLTLGLVIFLGCWSTQDVDRAYFGFSGTINNVSANNWVINCDDNCDACEAHKPGEFNHIPLDKNTYGDV